MDFLMLLSVVYEILAIYLVAKFVTTLVFSLIAIIYVHWLVKVLFKPVDLVQRYGKWAVVTGCTDGIGKYYAKELASRKMNVVLISRNPDKLKAVAQEIQNESEVATIVVEADFTSGQDVYKKIEEQIKDLDIGVLVNNVGISHRQPLPIETMTSSELWDLVLVNVGAATAMTHLVLPGMKRRGRGAIVNVSSFFTRGPSPFYSLYGASKAYLKSFSDALRFECQGTGVEVQTLSPAFVNTQLSSWLMANRAGTSLFVPSPQIFAKHAVTTLGVAQKTTGYWPHEMQYQMVSKMLTDWMWDKTYSVGLSWGLPQSRTEEIIMQTEVEAEKPKLSDISEHEEENLENDFFDF